MFPFHGVREPGESFYDPLSRLGTGALDVPGPVVQLPQVQLVRDQGAVVGAGKILLVGENQDDRVAGLVVFQDVPELLLGLGEPLLVRAVKDKDQCVIVLEVVAPEVPKCLEKKIYW